VANKLVDLFIEDEKIAKATGTQAAPVELNDPFLTQPSGDLIRGNADPEQYAKDAFSDAKHALTFGATPDQVESQREIMDGAVNDEFSASVRATEAEERLTGFAPLGVEQRTMFPGDVPIISKEMMQFELDRAIEKNVLTADEIADAKERIATGDFDDIPEFMAGRFTPEIFYDRSAAATAEKAIKGPIAGLLSVPEMTFQGIHWLGGESAAGQAAKAASDVVTEAREAISPGRQDFIFDTFAGFGTMTGFLVPSTAATKALTPVAKLSRPVAAWMNAGFMTVFESFGIAGSTYEQSLEQSGGDVIEARRAARFSFFSNLPISLVANKVLVTKAKGRVTNSIISQGAEEGLQSIAEDIALDRPVDFGSAWYEAQIGAIVGGGTSAVLSRLESAPDPTMPPEVATQYDSVVKAKLDEGLALEDAHVEATRAISTTEAGREYIEGVAEGADAAFKLEAMLGEPEPPQLGVAGVFAEADTRIDSLIDSALTEDQVIDEILNVSETEAAAGPSEVQIEATARANADIALIREGLPAATSARVANRADLIAQDARLEPLLAPGTRAYTVTMPGGREISVINNATVTLDEGRKQTILDTYFDEEGKPVSPDIQFTPQDVEAGRVAIAGANFAIGESGIIALSKTGGKAATVNEELFELVEKMGLLTDEELAAVGDNLEARSKAYAKWNGESRTPEGVFEIVRDFFRKLVNLRNVTAEDVFQRVREGEVFEREVTDRQRADKIKSNIEQAKQKFGEEEAKTAIEAVAAPSPYSVAERSISEPLRRATEEAGVTDDQLINSIVDNFVAKQRESLDDAGVPGWAKRDFYGEYMQELWDYAHEAGIDVGRVHLDIGHMAGMNAELGHAATDKHIIELLDIIKQGFIDSGFDEGNMNFTRTGGDEFAVEIPGADKKQVDKAMESAIIEIERYVDDNNLRGLSAVKELADGTEVKITKDVKMHFNTSAFSNHDTLDNMLTNNDAKVEQQSEEQEAKHVTASETEKARAREIGEQSQEVESRLEEENRRDLEQAAQELEGREPGGREPAAGLETFAVEFDTEGKPVFDPADMLDSLESRLFSIGLDIKAGRKPTLPAFFFDKDGNQIYTEQNAKAALDKVRAGRELNPDQHDLILAALAEASADFYQEAIRKQGEVIAGDDFLDEDVVIEFAEGELDAIVEKGMQSFINTLKVRTEKRLTPAQKKVKEAQGTARQLNKEMAALTRTLEDKIASIENLDMNLRKQREHVREHKKENKKLAEKIARREAQIEKLRAKSREAAASVARESVKTRVRRATGQAAPDIPLIREDIAFREVLKAQVKAARQATGTARKAAIAEMKQQFSDRISQKALKEAQTALRQNIRGKIRKELRSTKVKKVSGKPRGKFTPEVQNVLDMLRNAAKMNVADARARIDDNLAQYQDTIPPDNVALENRVLAMVAGFDNRTIGELEQLLREIKLLKDEGEMIAELKKFNRQARDEKARAAALGVISGDKGLPKGITAGEKIARAQLDRNMGITDRAKRWFAHQGVSIVGWKDVLDILSRLDKTSKPFQSALSKEGDVLKAKNAEKAGIRENTEKVQDLYKVAYGLKSPRAMLRRVMDDSKPIFIGTFNDAFGNQVELEMSRAEARKRYMEMQDPDLMATFTEGMGYTQDMIAAITEALTPQDKAFADSQLAYYRQYYNTVNETYRDIYGVDLPFNPNYSPIRREGVAAKEEVGFGEFLQEINLNASVSSGSLKSRVANIRPLRQQSDLAVLEQHISEMEHFKAWAERSRELQAVFNDPDIRTAIKVYHDKDILGVVDNFMADFVRNGAERSGNLNWLDKLRGNIARSVLAVKVSIGVKQLTSFIAFADDIPVKDFVAGTADFWKNPIENAKFLKEHSELLKSRGQTMERDIQTALKSDEYSAWRKGANFLNTLMLNVQMGDQGAIVMGGWPVFKYHLDRGASVEEAIQKFEQSTESAQQSADLSELSKFQRAGSFAKLFTMFLSSPNQYVRKEIAAVRNLLAGRQGVQATAKTLVIYHMLLPMLFQFVSDGFTWDEDEQKRAVILGPLNGIFILGSMLEGVIREALGQKVFDDEVPVVSLADDARRAMKLITEDDMDAEDTLKAIRSLAGLVGALTGTPTKTAVDIAAGVDEILTGEFDKGLAEVLGWSPSVAEKITE
jgi:GGDEF domain-containing protein